MQGPIFYQVLIHIDVYSRTNPCLPLTSSLSSLINEFYLTLFNTQTINKVKLAENRILFESLKQVSAEVLSLLQN